MIWIWIIAGIIVTLWGIIIIWRCVQANSSSSGSSSYVRILNKQASKLSIEWGGGPVTNGYFSIYSRKPINIFSPWTMIKQKPGNGYTGDTDSVVVPYTGFVQIKVIGDNYVFGIDQKSIS